MEISNGLAAIAMLVVLLVGGLAGAGLFPKIIEIETDKIIYQDRLIEKECAACPEIVIPEIESADNYLLNEYLEDMFSDEFDAIKDEAELYAELELEDDDHEVIVEYLMSLIEGIEEDSIEIEDIDTEVVVTKLGLKDEEAAARVTFEIEVDYEVRVESEYGYVAEEYSKDIVVIYDVVFEEVNFDVDPYEFGDEEVEFVSIE